MLTIKEINDMDVEKLNNLFGNVVENYPEILSKVYSQRPFQNTTEMCDVFCQQIQELSPEEKLKILKLHPVLAGKQADNDELTMESNKEHKQAGLKSLDFQNKCKLRELNNKYLEKFDFPFIICARENTADTIIEKLEKRIQNSIDEELNTGINEVKKICKLRLLDLVDI